MRTEETPDLSPLETAMELLDRHATLNDRYRRLIADARPVFVDPAPRGSQVRGVAKKLIVLVRAARAELDRVLAPEQVAAVERGERVAWRVLRDEPRREPGPVADDRGEGPRPR
ncbi:hypothetical protein C1701_04080 [Actinoalloteichus sp. AHMU CJ021]|uniref:hypothetical protein n=1 Tax=Actinoalloteichus sp. AHMU CJ021 TaxID=2072503 RepID=UPI000CA079BF|nr:hypothetical protein C1701_04080 [Actinoalloteichus sp. AHMU CJ021]